MAKEIKIQAGTLAAGAALFIAAVIWSGRAMLENEVRFALFLAVYLVVAFHSFYSISSSLARKKLEKEHLLMVIATVGALAVGHYAEAVAAMLLFQIGCILEAVSVDRTKRTIEKFIDIRPAYATRKEEDGEVQVEPSQLELGDVIIIKPGERVPVDAVILNGNTSLDTKALTGEAMPDSVGPGSRIYSGSINMTGVVEAQVKKLYKDSTVSRIMELVEGAQQQKADSEGFVRKFTRIYTPVAVLAALLIMVCPPLFITGSGWETWIYRGMIVLIAACPTGLILSVPIAFLGGIASAAHQGIVVKGGNYLEMLAKVDTFVFDKTGTLTEGTFTVTRVRPEGLTKEELLEITAHVESYSNHPIAQSLMSAYGGTYDPERVTDVEEMPGYGISASYNGSRVHIGNLRMMEEQGLAVEQVKTIGTVIYVAREDQYAGYIVIEDRIRDNARWTMKMLRERYNAVLVMLTGDSRAAGNAVAKELQLDYTYTELMPEDKLEQMEEFMQYQYEAERVACVGDGINDAPVLARADVGIAMGALGSDAAIEAADIVLLEDELPKVVDAVRIARETVRVVSQNINFALIMKFVVLLLAAAGYITMWESVFTDVGVMIISIINAAGVVKYSV